MAQAAPQSGAHLRGRERHAVASARAIASGKGVNDVVGAGAALADHRSTAGHDFMNTSDVQKQDDSQMANHAGIPNLVSEVSCALCSAVKSVPRSSVYASFQQ